MAGIALTRPPNVVGAAGFILVSAGLLVSVAAGLPLFWFLANMMVPIDQAAPVDIADDWLPTIVAIRCGFGVIVVGTIASLFGLRRKPKKLARWGAVLGLLVVATASAMSIWTW